MGVWLNGAPPAPRKSPPVMVMPVAIADVLQAPSPPGQRPSSSQTESLNVSASSSESLNKPRPPVMDAAPVVVVCESTVVTVVVSPYTVYVAVQLRSSSSRSSLSRSSSTPYTNAGSCGLNGGGGGNTNSRGGGGVGSPTTSATQVVQPPPPPSGSSWRNTP